MDYQQDAHEEIIDCETVCSITQKMLDNAKAGEWDDLAIQEGRRISMIKKVFGTNTKKSISPLEAERQSDLIKKIISMDHQTRDLIIQKMSGLRDIFNSEKKIIEAYGPHT